MFIYAESTRVNIVLCYKVFLREKIGEGLC